MKTAIVENRPIFPCSSKAKLVEKHHVFHGKKKIEIGHQPGAVEPEKWFGVIPKPQNV